MITVNFQNCHDQNGIGCGYDIEQSGNRIYFNFSSEASTYDAH